MKLKKQAVGTAAAVGMLLLILDGKTALQGAREGITLCLETVIPSLFPFFLVSALANRAWYGTSVPILGKLFHMTPGTETLLIPGFLGGYPVGAQCIGQLYHSGQLPRRDAVRLLTFCSNAGPSFLFGMLRTVFPSVRILWLCWGIQILSALTAAQFSSPCISEGTSVKTVQSTETIIRTALNAIAQVCGWVITFRVLLSFLNRLALWALPALGRVLVTGLLELTNGCCMLNAIPWEDLRFLLCNLFLSFGGVCVALQTASVIYDLPLSAYLKGKLIQSGVSLILSFAVLRTGWWILLLWLVFFCPAIKKSGKTVPAVV